MAKDLKYFKTKIHALQVVVGDPDPTKGEVAPQTLSFVPYYVYERGSEGKQRYGFLATDNGSAIKKLSNDFNVVEIDEKEFKAATEEKRDESDELIAGERAPY